MSTLNGINAGLIIPFDASTILICVGFRKIEIEIETDMFALKAFAHLFLVGDLSLI